MAIQRAQTIAYSFETKLKQMGKLLGYQDTNKTLYNSIFCC
jgi:hypothetical protein